MNMNLLDVNLGGGYVLQYANRYKYQMMGYLVETPDNKTLMIDSGQPYEEDAMYLYSLLTERNKKVDTWIITHAHDDHFGSLMYLMENLPQFDIEIGELYFDFPDTEWLLTVEGGNSYAPCKKFLSLLDKLNIKPKKLTKNTTLKCGELDIEVLKDCEGCEKYPSVNDTSAVLRLHFPKRDILFLGDLGTESGKDFVNTIPHEKLRCDIVQMSHHGQNGVTKEFYEVVKPKICLYCAPDWLWENVGPEGKGTGPFKTLITREWMEELGAVLSCPHAYGDFKLF